MTSVDFQKCQKDLIEPPLTFNDYKEIEKKINGNITK